MAEIAEIENKYLSLVKKMAGDSIALEQSKTEALAHFFRMGFPTTRNEEWKYTPTLGFSKSTIDYGNTYVISNKEVIADSVLASENRIVFINGSLSLHHSTFSADIDFMPMNAAINHPKYISNFNRLANNSAEAYTAFNTAFFSEGAFIVVKKNSSMQIPVLIEYHETEAATDYLQNIRNLIILESAANASIIVKHYVGAAAQSLSNTMNELILEANAQCEVFQIQDQLADIQHINTWEVEQNRDASCHFFTYTDSGQLVRNNLHIAMNAPGLMCDTKGIYIAGKKSVIDNHLKIEHQLPHCNSFQLYRGIMKEEGTGVFNGKILVHKDAQKTDAYQSNKNLLLSPTANIYTKPQLEIFADDVKCSHGATIGNLDENAMFYCLARGIDPITAKSLLINAFANDVVKKVSNHRVKNYIEQTLRDRLEN